MSWNWLWTWRCSVCWLAYSFGEGFAYTVRRKSASCSFEEELKNGRCVWRASANRAVCWAVCCRLGRGALVMPT